MSYIQVVAKFYKDILTTLHKRSGKTTSSSIKQSNKKIYHNFKAQKLKTKIKVVNQLQSKPKKTLSKSKSLTFRIRQTKTVS